MAITPSSGSYNLKIKPSFDADTLAELEQNLADYVGQYVRVADQNNKIFFVKECRQGPSLTFAYEPTFYEAVAATEGDRNLFFQSSSGTPTVPSDADTSEPFLLLQSDENGASRFWVWEP